MVGIGVCWSTMSETLVCQLDHRFHRKYADLDNGYEFGFPDVVRDLSVLSVSTWIHVTDHHV